MKTAAVRESTKMFYGRIDLTTDDQLLSFLNAAANATGAAGAAIALLDETRDHFARVVLHGTAAPHVVRSLALSALAEDAFVVTADARTDPRFASALEADARGATRMFAAVRLRDETGMAAGVLCVLDGVPRKLTVHERAQLLTIKVAAEALLAVQSQVARLRVMHAGHLAELATLRALHQASAALPMVTTDLAGTILSLNASAERCLRARGASIVEQRQITSYAGGVPGLKLEDLLGTARTGEVDERDWTYRRHDGTTFLANVSAGGIRDEDGTTTGYVFVIKDVTDRRRAEEATKLQRDEIAAANVKLASSAKLKDDLIAGMNHELRTPLNAVLGLTEALEEGVYGPLGSEQRSAVRKVRTCGEQLLTLGDDLIAILRAERHQLHLAIEPVLVGELCRASVEAVKTDARRKRLALTLKVDADLTVIDADRGRLQQILVALWRSVITAAVDGSAIGLAATSSDEGETVRFAMWASAGALPLGRGSGDQAPPQVALVLTRSLVKLHGGTLLVEHESDLQFILTMPRTASRSSSW